MEQRSTPRESSRRRTLRDIAERAGVSVSTVSRVLNAQGGISAATRQRVLEVVQELGYRPHGTVRRRTARRTGTLGFVALRGDAPTHFTTASHPLVGVDRECQRRGYHLITTFMDEEALQPHRVLPMLEEQRVDGLILVGPNLPPAFIRSLYHHGVPLVLFDNLLPESDLDCVLHENEESVYRLTRHLIHEHGHRALIFLSGPEEWVSSRERAAGYRRACLEAGLKPETGFMPDTTFQTGHTAMRDVLERRPEITAVVAVNDAVALGAMAACREFGRPVPEAMAVVGFDDVRWAAHQAPPLTTVRVHGEAMGREAARHLLDRIEHPADEHVQVCIRVATHVVIRQSCGCPSQTGDGDPVPPAQEGR